MVEEQRCSLEVIMDVKQAVASAREHLIEVFSGEIASPPSLEEVWFDDDEKQWCVTFGLKRTKASGGFGSIVLPFDYKVVRLDEADGKPISIRDRSIVRDH
jgi:hypothetical protein